MPIQLTLPLCGYPLLQGREKDICLFSAVRSPAAPKKGGRRPGIGFVADERRINVGLTRARCSLIVIGNVRALQVRGCRGVPEGG